MLKVLVVLCLVGTAVSGPPVARTKEEIRKFADFLESTRNDHGVLLRQNVSPGSSTWVNSGKYQGDILLDNAQVDSMIQQFSEGRNAYIWPGTRWPSRTVVYDFAARHFNTAQINHILYSMSVLEDRTCIRFRRRTAFDRDYTLITGNPDGCYANVGFWAGRGVHVLNLARDAPGRGCLNTIVVIHELLHVIGFFHMQSTHDRDQWVRINWNNIVRGMEYNFERYGSNLVSNVGLDYEYDSCMHYGPYDFSVNGRTTIDALRPNNGQMGQTSYVTGHDFYRVDRHYLCSPWREAEQYEPFYDDAPVPDEVSNNDIEQAELEQDV